MTRLGMLIDVAKCNGCYACFMACRDEFCGNDHSPYSAAQPYAGQFWMRLIARERGNYPRVKMAYIASPCMHCADAPCVQQAPEAVHQRPDGVVIVDPEKAKGKREIVASCPYNAVYWNEEKQLPQKCTMCAHLLDQGWKRPRCVEVCPMGALSFGDLDDPQSDVSRRAAEGGAEGLHPEYGLRENVLYLNLPRRFLAGSVVFGDTDRCARGVTVTLAGSGERREVVTNGFGDFEFEGLLKDREYTLRLVSPGYAPATLQADTKRDRHLGEVVLSRE